MNGDLHQLTGAYVLDSLDDLERQAFERHLDSCEACRAEVHELSETVAALGAAEATDPPAHLRSEVLAQVARTPQVAPHPAPARRPGTRPWWSVAAVAAVAVGAFVLGSFVTQQRSQPAPVAQAPIDTIVTAPDARLSRMALPGDARSTVVVSPQQDRAAVFVAGLPTPRTDRVYQLWRVGSDDRATSAGVFRTDQRGAAQVIIEGDFSGTAAVAITEEPDGGSPQPTSEPLGVAPLA